MPPLELPSAGMALENIRSCAFADRGHHRHRHHRGCAILICTHSVLHRALVPCEVFLTPAGSTRSHAVLSIFRD